MEFDENEFNHNWKAYPNPTNQIFIIDLGESYTDIYVTITDMTGRIIRDLEFVDLEEIIHIHR